MQYHTYEEQKRRIILAIILILVFFILCVLGIRGCSNTHKPNHRGPDISTGIDPNAVNQGGGENSSSGTGSDTRNRRRGNNNGIDKECENPNGDNRGNKSIENETGEDDKNGEKTPPVGVTDEVDEGVAGVTDCDTCNPNPPEATKNPPKDNRRGNKPRKPEKGPDPKEPESYQPPTPSNPPTRVDPPLTKRPSPPGILDGPVGIIIFIVLLIIFIISIVISRRGILIIWTSSFDKFLVIAAAALFFISCLFDLDVNSPPLQIVVILRSISGGLMLWSAILSIIANFPNLLYIILSILAKVFVFYCVCVGFVIALVVIVISFVLGSSGSNSDD